MKPIIFISCGQRKGTDEVILAKKIHDELSNLGFLPYIAVNDQSPLAIRENVFDILSRSDYFLFVDLKRDSMDVLNWTDNTTRKSIRGSLISHQELAIASFLEIPTIAFQEAGVEKYDGLIGFLQLNCIEFQDRETLPQIISGEFEKRGFVGKYQNQIQIESLECEDFATEGHPARGYFLKISNKAMRKQARNCIAFIDKIVHENNGPIRFETAELKWRGVMFPNVTIQPESFRYLDACWFFYDSEIERKIQFNVLTDSGRHIPYLWDFGKYEITFVVHSDNFPPAKATCILEYEPIPDVINMKMKDV